MKRVIIACIIVCPFQVFSQEKKDEPKYGINFSGFVKSDFFYDSRETYSIREGHFLLYPKEKLPDKDYKDINAVSSFNFLSIQSRLTGKITAPDAFGAKVTGILEADFFGNEATSFVDVNGFRLRHAYVKMDWDKTELLAGQFWHPFFITGCFSGVISFNTGAPMQPFSRNPQFKILHKTGKVSMSAILSAQRDFTSPLGSASIRYSSIPDLTALISYEDRNSENNTEFLSGFGLNYKTLKPLLSTTRGTETFKTDERVSGISATAFLKVKNKYVTSKIQGIYGENLYDMTMLGGYGINSVTDPTKNKVSYSTINNFTSWAELNSNGEKLQYGIWAGYTQNLGSGDSVLYYTNKVDGTDATVRGANIKWIFRASPRIVFIRNKLQIATELEYTTAAYAAKDTSGNLYRDAFGVITKTENVSNLRILLAFILNF